MDVIDVLVKVGDTVNIEDALITLESDKATMDIPSPTSGVVTEIKVNTGDKISEGATILLIDETESSHSSAVEEIVGETPTESAASSPDPTALSASSLSVMAFGAMSPATNVSVKISALSIDPSEISAVVMASAVMVNIPVLSKVASPNMLTPLATLDPLPTLIQC